MIKDKKGDKARLYRGYYKPAGLAAKDKKIDGWHNETADEFPAIFNTTYNDTADVEVTGNTVQKSEWVHKQGQSSQENPLKNQLPEDKRKFEGWSRHQGSAVTLTQGISVEEWNTAEATRIQTSGGTAPTKYYYNVLTYQSMPVGRKSQIRIYIKNIGSNPVHLSCNQWDNWGDYPRDLVIQPNENKLVVLNGLQTAASHWQIQFSTLNINDDLDFIAYQPEAYLMDEVPQPDNPFPITSNLPAGTYKTKDWKGDWWEFTLTEDLHGIDDVRDGVEWDKYSHNGFLRGEMGVKVFDGTETWNITNNCFYYTIASSPVKHISITGFCTHYKQGTVSGLWNNTIDMAFVLGSGYFGSATSSHTAIRDSRFSNVTAFKAELAAQYAAGTPVIVIYQLATPTRTPLTFTLNNSSTAPECPMEFLTDTPSLEYPAEVFDASGAVSVRGKNLFDLTRFTATANRGNIAITQVQNGLRLSNQTQNTYCRCGRLYQLQPSTAYVLTRTATVISGYTGNPTYTGLTRVHDGVLTSAEVVGNPASLGSAFGQGVKTLSFTTPASGLVWIVFFTNYDVSETTTIEFTDIQLELGSVATTYEPYRPEVSAPIPPLRSNHEGTVCDEFEVKTGNLTRKIGRIESYNGEDVGDDWISSTGALDTGATVEYVLAEPIEEQHAPVILPTYYPTTVIEIDNHSPASVEEAEVEVKVQDVWEE